MKIKKENIMFENNYDEYKHILQEIISTNKICSFLEAENKDEFLVLRHDIEFSIDKAYKMACIESQNGVRATYFVQLGNYAYNPFSDVNKAKIREIYNMGHDIGLHYRQNNEESIHSQIFAMQEILNVPIKSFSTHRPKKETNYDKYFVNGIVNAYSNSFFTRTENADDVDVKYISDSKFQWNYGYPNNDTLMQYKKVQLLVHPFQWSEKNCSMADCFKKMLSMKMENMKKTFLSEFVRLKEEDFNGCKKMEI